MLKNKKFWAYEYSQTFELKQEVMDGYKHKGRFYDDIIAFYDMMGMTPHPCLKLPFGKENTDPNIIAFVNILVDINTLKILFAIIPNAKVITLKFSSNLFEYNNLEFLVNSLISVNKPNNIFNFIFEWNYKIIHEGNIYYFNEMNKYAIADQYIYNHLIKMQSLICKLSTSNKLEALCLRGNYLGDDNAIIIFDYLKTNQFLKILNLYKSNLTSKCIQSICHMLESNKKLEELNLGGNYLKDEDLSQLKNYLGKIPMTHEQVETHHKKIKERDLIIEKNKKLKILKKPEEPIPVIEEVALIGDIYYHMKNVKLRNLNIMQNAFTEKCLDNLIYIIDITTDLFITIDGKIFNKTKEILIDPHGKYYMRIYLTK